MSTPLISIIMPCYNAERFIETSIQSVLAQTRSDWELLLCDDCSSDRTPAICQEWVERDRRIHYFRASENRGVGAARNLGLEKARGRYIAFLDSDDLWLPERLERHIAFMETNRYAFSFCNYSFIDELGKAIAGGRRFPNRINRKQLLGNSIIGTPHTLIDREELGTIRMPELRTHEDFALWLDILEEVDYAYYFDETLCEVRISRSSLSANKFREARAMWRFYRAYLRLGFLRSIYYFFSYAYHAVKKRLF